MHRLGEFLGRHLPVGNKNTGFGNDAFEAGIEVANGVNAIVKVVGLTTTGNLFTNRGGKGRVLIPLDDGLHGHTIERRRLNQREIAGSC